LVETIIALLLSSLVLVLVSGTFLAQSQYYSSQALHVGVHDNARVATERVAAELRSSMEDGVVVAGRRTLTVRSPIKLAVVCERVGNNVYVHFDGGAGALDVGEVGGVALRDGSTGAWDYQNTTWAYVNGGTAGAPGQCNGNGADTSAAAFEFHHLDQLQTLFPSAPDPGEVLMLFRETTFKILPSVLDTMTLGLYRQVYGGSLVEFATGMDTTAQFQYRTGGSTYADTITAGSVGNIDAVRIVADARLPSRSGGRPDVTFGWSVNVALRNVP
jgi:hypothetical protein